MWAPGYSSRHTRGRVKGAPLSIGDLPADTILCLCRALCPPGETQPHMKRVRGEEVKAQNDLIWDLMLPGVTWGPGPGGAPPPLAPPL